ncbi:MAG TPA: hypothetical protein DCX14_04715 [Flavobacteriales bacterium]|jgi:tetratricopeptide (TPR) repeat protein|nr:tetratricopeptide repeat protein [Flavobacteriales bacterium]MDB9701297.1 tetratricopeptide repeat protein [Salibacteraceae bacterium]HAW19466.1 hypothetical protein [Flavobacteriales bacterium]
MRNLAITILLSLGFFSLMAQSPQRIEAMRMLQKGDNLVQMGHFEDAIFSYTNAIATDNAYAEAFMKRSSMLQRLGRTTEAKRDYETALRLNPYSAFVLDEKAKLNFMIEKYGEGLENLEHAIAMQPDNHQLRDHRVDGYILTGEYISARNDIELLKESGYNKELTLLKHGLIQFLENELYLARVSFEAVLEINPENALAYDVLGLIALKEKNIDEAIGHFDQAIAINPDFALAIYNKGVAYKMNGLNEKALDLFDQAIEIQLDIAPVYFARGLLKKELGDMKGAIEDYSQMNTFDTTYFNAIYNRAFAYEMIGDFDNALIDANHAIELNPDDAHAWKLRGNIHMLFGDYGEAVIDYTQALKLDGEMIEALFSRGLSKVLNYRLKDGCEDMRLAREMGYEGADEAISNFCGH